jgi:hypothetical protein
MKARQTGFFEFRIVALVIAYCFFNRGEFAVAGLGLCAGRGAGRAQRPARAPPAPGDGFADRFPAAAPATLLKAKLTQAALSKADWIAIESIGVI